MLVEDVMTPHPVTTTAGATIQQALALLDTYSVTSLPVVDTAGRVCGVVSEADLIGPASGPSTLVANVYSPHAVTAGRHDDLARAVELLTSRNLNSLPVVGRKGVVVGVLSRSDVVHVLARANVATTSAVAEALEPS